MITKTRTDLLPDVAPVSLSSTIDVDVANAFKLDRYLGDPISLPYNFEDIKIQPNELCVSDNINASLYKLYYNFLYLNAQTKIASNNIPKNYKGYIACTKELNSAEVVWYGSDTTSTSAADHMITNDTTGTVLSALVDGVFVKSVGALAGYVGFVANSATMVAVQINEYDTIASVRDTYRLIEDATAITFSNIKSLAINTENNLFVCDGVSIYKFDVDSVLTANPAVSAVGRFLIKTIGGISKDIYDKGKFSNPVSIRTGKDNKLYVLDRGDNGYKIYDKDLNWISTAAKKTDFQTTTGAVVDIAVNVDDEHVYILADSGTIFEYGSDNVLIKTYILQDLLEPDEKFRRLVFSKIDTNIVYVLTNKNVYKKFKSKLTKSIGAFRLSDNLISGERFTFINAYHVSGSTDDYIFVGGESVATVLNEPVDIGKIFKFDESVVYQTIVYDEYKSETYSLSSINVDNDEYVTAWVINKTLHKLRYSHLLLKDNMHAKYVGKYDDVGRIQYDGVNYITDSDPNIFTYPTTLDSTIGINEPVLARTINRPLNELYKMQLQLVDMCREKYSNKYPFANQVVVVP